MSQNNPSRKHAPSLSTPVRLGVAAVAACFIASPVLANPVNPVVVNGAATFNQVGKVLTVTNSNGAIINWDKFSIKAGETTRFDQPSASSSVMNRVLNDPTAIYGTLSSNGRVWLINPAGIMVGPGGRIDTAAFVASTLNIRNEDFLAGRKLFVNDGSAKDIINQGEIRTPAGGSVYLIGSNVANQGIITTPKGETILAAGATVSLIDSATPGVKVEITGAEGNSTNLGTITAEAGRIGIAGVIVRNSGLLNASSVVSEGGRVFLKASQDAYVDGNGRIVTTGTKGGSVEVLGNRVAVMDQAEIDASGANGGGQILVGGDYQGKNPEIQNASISYFGKDAALKADATDKGDGGKVIIWADDTTRAYGSISARGGASGGDGGFVETSGRNHLSVSGIRVDTRAPQGRTGTWLLDPGDLTLLAGAGASDDVVYGAGIFTTSGTDGSSVVYSDTIQTALGFSNVVLQTDGGSGGSGNITATNVSIGSGNGSSLTLAAYGGGGATHGNITISNSSFVVYGGLNLLAGWDGSGFGSGNVISGRGDINISGSLLQSNVGAVNFWAGHDIALSNSGNNGTWIQGATMDVRAGNNLTLSGGSGDISSPQGPGVALYSTGTQFVSAGNQILLQAGSANNTVYGGSMSGGGVGIASDGDQTISAKLIKLYAGASGHDNAAWVQAYGSQTINITGSSGLLELKGGGDSSSAVYGGAGSYNNQARIQHGQWGFGDSYTGTGDQRITVYGGGSVNLQAGSGTGVLGYYDSACGIACQSSSNDATIYNGIGDQTLDFPAGGSLTITGGSAGTSNEASINNQLTALGQFILGRPNITLTGGSGGGSAVSYGGEIFQLSNDAGINSKGTGVQFIDAGTITINAGNATYGGAGFSNESGHTLTINTSGNLSLYGGASSAGDPLASGAYIGNEYGGTINLNIGGNLYVKSGSGTSSQALIGTLKAAADVNIVVGGNVEIIAAASDAGIGTQSGYGGQVTMQAGGSMSFTGGTTGGVLIGSLSDSDGATTVNLYSGNNITATGNSGGVLFGVKTPGGSSGSTILLISGWNRSAGSGGAPSGYGGDITLSGPVQMQTDGNNGLIDVVAHESSAGARGSISLGAGTSAYGKFINIVAAGNNDIAGSLVATGDIYLDSGWNDYGGNPSLRGGNLTLAATSHLESGGVVDMYSQVGTAAPYGGGIITQNGSLVSSGDISMYADRHININGSVTGYGGLYLQAGYSETHGFGGNVVFGSTSQVKADGQIKAYGYSGAESVGSIVQNAGSSIVSFNGGTAIGLYADGDVQLNGRVEATSGQLQIYAGLDNSNSQGDPDSQSARGGNIVLGASSDISAGHVEIIANRGSSDATTGNVIQSAGGHLETVVFDSLNIYAAGNVELLGTSVVNNGAPVHIEAGYDYPCGACSQEIAGKHITINSLSADGSDVELYATGPILAYTHDAGTISAYIANSSSGGIFIGNTGTVQPSAVTLDDDATTNSSVAFTHTGSDLTPNSDFNFATHGGAGSILVAAPENNLNYYGGPSFSGSSLILAAGDTLNINDTLSFNGSLGLGAGNTLNINQAVQANDVLLGAPTIKVNGPSGYVLANNDLTMNAGSIFADGAEGFLAGHNINATVQDHITLDNAGMFAGNDINLKLMSSDSELSLSNGAHLWANALTTITIDFSARGSGGVFINGVETARNDGYTGFFSGPDKDPAVEGVSLFINYPSINTVLDLCRFSPTLCTFLDPSLSPIVSEVNPPPKPEKDKTAKCDEGSFGCADDKDGKKDEKSAPKKLATCGV